MEPKELLSPTSPVGRQFEPLLLNRLDVMEKVDINTGWVAPVPDEARVYGYHEEMRHFVEYVKTNKMPRETDADGYVVSVVLEACYRSMKTKKWETIDL